MDSYVAKLPRILRHLKLMIKDRGHDYPYDEHTDFINGALDRGCSIGEFLSATLDKLHIAFVDPIFDVVRDREIMTSRPQLWGVTKNELETIVIVFAKLSPDANKFAATIKKRVTILYGPSALAFPLSQHVLVYKHVLLNKAEEEEFKARYKIEKNQLPILRLSDPVRTWYGWPRFGIVRIERPVGNVWRYIK